MWYFIILLIVDVSDAMMFNSVNVWLCDVNSCFLVFNFHSHSVITPIRDNR